MVSESSRLDVERKDARNEEVRDGAEVLEKLCGGFLTRSHDEQGGSVLMLQLTIRKVGIITNYPYTYRTDFDRPDRQEQDEEERRPDARRGPTTVRQGTLNVTSGVSPGKSYEENTNTNVRHRQSPPGNAIMYIVARHLDVRAFSSTEQGTRHPSDDGLAHSSGWSNDTGSTC